MHTFRLGRPYYNAGLNYQDDNSVSYVDQCDYGASVNTVWQYSDLDLSNSLIRESDGWDAYINHSLITNTDFLKNKKESYKEKYAKEIEMFQMHMIRKGMSKKTIEVYMKHIHRYLKIARGNDALPGLRTKSTARLGPQAAGR